MDDSTRSAVSRRHILGIGLGLAGAAAVRPVTQSAARFTDRADANVRVAVEAPAIPLFDHYDRPNSADLGATSTGQAPWIKLRGDWDISSNRIRNLSGTNPAAVVDALTPDVDVRLSISPTGRDAIVFRASDMSNWWALSMYRNTTSSTSCVTDTEFTRTCANSSVTQFITKTGCGSCPGCSGSYPLEGGCSASGTCQRDCTTSTTTTRRVYLQKMVGGSLSTVNFWSAGNESLLRVRAIGDQLQLYRGTTLMSTVTDGFNSDATLHGVGRSQLGNNSGTALDNFDLDLAA